MKWLVFTVLGLAVLAALIAAIGAALPRDHAASRTLTTRHSPADVWAVIADPGFATAATGQDVPVEILESHPPHRMVSKIADPNLPFGGTWTYQIAATPTGSTLTIAENGFVSNVIFRFVSRFVIGHHATMDTYLKALAARLGDHPALSGE
jgi:hypothetical protein